MCIKTAAFIQRVNYLKRGYQKQNYILWASTVWMMLGKMDIPPERVIHRKEKRNYKGDLWLHAFPFGVEPKVLENFSVEKVQLNKKIEKQAIGKLIFPSNEHLQTAQQAKSSTIYIDTA
jgi:hypothetical protein